MKVKYNILRRNAEIYQPQVKKLQGYKTLEIDVTHGELPRYPELMEKYERYKKST